jgi:hypothetical protein
MQNLALVCSWSEVASEDLPLYAADSLTQQHLAGNPSSDHVNSRKLERAVLPRTRGDDWRWHSLINLGGWPRPPASCITPPIEVAGDEIAISSKACTCCSSRIRVHKRVDGSCLASCRSAKSTGFLVNFRMWHGPGLHRPTCPMTCDEWSYR